MATTRKATKTKVLATSPSVLVLQWLTYAFWGWTIAAAGWLTSLSAMYYLDRAEYSSGQSEAVAYSLAAVIVLLLISLICDAIYYKKESSIKSGPSMVLMIVHAVIFALLAIAGLIAAVFAVVNLLIGSNDSGATTTLFVGLVVAALYATTLARVLRIRVLRRRILLFTVGMIIALGSLISLGISGPASYARETRQDRIIEQNLPQLAENIRIYSVKNDKLPSNLNEIRSSVSEDVGDLIDRNVVEYKPGNVSAKQTIPEGKSSPEVSGNAYEYTLCVTYIGASNQKFMSSPGPMSPTTTPDTWIHPSGRVCYDLITQFVVY